MGGIDEGLVEPTVVVPVLGPGAGPDDDAWGAFASAWVPLQDRLFRLALLLTRDRADAEDAVSDVMAATFRPWRSGRVESLDAYARRAVVNRVVGRSRRRAVAERFSRGRSADDRGERELADDVAERDLLQHALRALPPRQRAIVVLRYYALLSVADTAVALGCAEGTVKSQTHDALATLRSWLGPAEEARS